MSEKVWSTPNKNISTTFFQHIIFFFSGGGIIKLNNVCILTAGGWARELSFMPALLMLRLSMLL